MARSAERQITPPLSREAAYAHARASAWLEALEQATDTLPPRQEIHLAAVSAVERLTLAAFLYEANVTPSVPGESGPVRVSVILTPRPDKARALRRSLRNAAVLEPWHDLLAESRRVLALMNQHWPGGPPEDAAPLPRTAQDNVFANTRGRTAQKMPTADFWTARDWADMGARLEALWRLRAALVQSPEGWLADPTALPLLEEAVRRAPDLPLAQLLLAESALQHGLPQRAVEACNLALHAQPGLSRARYIRALGHWRLQQPALAEDDLDVALAALEASPDRETERAQRLRARGAMRLLRRHYPGMCEDFTQACALGDCDGLALAREQGYCPRTPPEQEEAAESTGPGAKSGAKSAAAEQDPARLPSAFLIRPPKLP